MSQHRTKLNREKRGRDRIFYVTIKNSTQCKEVRRDITSKLNIEESCRDMKTRS